MDNRLDRSESAAELILLVLVAALAVLVLYRSPWSASDLTMSPDEFEYAAAARRLVTHGEYGIVVNGRTYPPRYQPWFSAVVLAPAYALLGHEIGNGICPVLLFGVLGVLAAYGAGHRISGHWGGLASACLVLLTPHFRFYGREIMTDVPACALGLVGCWLFMRMYASPRARDFALAGVVVAAAAALRVVLSALAIPFVLLAWWRRATSGFVVGAALTLLPMVAIHGLTALYNLAAFGDWARTGRHFWRPVPLDYPELLYSSKYVSLNLWWLVAPSTVLALAWGLAGATILVSVAGFDGVPGGRRALAGYAVLAGTIPSLAHLFFFFLDLRFHLLGFSLAAVVGGAGLGAAILNRFGGDRWLAAGVTATLVVAAGIYRAAGDADPIPHSRIFAESIVKATPANAVVITGADPPFLELMAGQGSTRQFVPIARWVKYANTLVAPVRVANPVPYPRGATDLRCQGLANEGAYDVYPFTAQERLDLIERWWSERRPVWVDLSFVHPADRTLARLDRMGALTPFPAYPWLAELKPKRAAPASGTFKKRW